MTKILVVEDNPAILDFCVEFFGDSGFEVKSAEDAPSAIAAHGQFKPDVILLDLNIPGGGGMLVFETVRRQSLVPIIFSTGKPETIGNLAELKNVSVVKKPTDPEVLLAEVRRQAALFSERPMNPVPPPPPPPRMPPGRP